MAKKIGNIPEFIKLFTEGKIKNLEEFRTYLVYDYGDLSVLQYKKVSERMRYSSDRGGHYMDKEIREEILAYRFPDGSCICNANQIREAGKGTVYGKTDREGENEIQRILQRYGAVPLPFTLFTESKLDVRDFLWICKPTPETVTVKRPKEIYNHQTEKRETIIEEIERHFVGAAIFKVEEEIFFFDIDRQELDHGIFNAFITKIPKMARTPEEAYALLMPDEVKTAISEGIDVKRQGEFFFVKISDEYPKVPPLTKEETKLLKCMPSKLGYLELTEIDEDAFDYPTRMYYEWELKTPGRIAFNEAMKKYQKLREKVRSLTGGKGTLGKSSSASHNVSKYLKIDEIVYVSGKVSQSRRQHADLTLDGWYKVIPNTGVFSWTITGQID